MIRNLNFRKSLYILKGIYFLKKNVTKLAKYEGMLCSIYRTFGRKTKHFFFCLGLKTDIRFIHKRLYNMSTQTRRGGKRFETLFNYEKSIYFYSKTVKNYFMRNRFFISRRLRKAMNFIRIPWYKRRIKKGITYVHKKIIKSRFLLNKFYKFKFYKRKKRKKRFFKIRIKIKKSPSIARAFFFKRKSQKKKKKFKKMIYNQYILKLQLFNFFFSFINNNQNKCFNFSKLYFIYSYFYYL